MNYLVTGGAGFIGSNLVRRLMADGHHVVVVDDLSTGFLRNLPTGADFRKLDLRDRDAVRGLTLPLPLTAVYHLAAQSSGEASFDDPERDIAINHAGTLHVLELARAVGCRRLLYASSMSVYGEIDASVPAVSENSPCRPSSYYGVNKLASEHLIRVFSLQHTIDWTAFRFFSVYGPGQNMHNLKQGIVSIYMSYLMHGKPIHVKGALDRFRDLIYVDDVIEAMVRTEQCVTCHGQVFNVGTGQKTTVESMVRGLLAAYGKTDFRSWVNVDGSTPGDIKGFVADMTLLGSAIGWVPQTPLFDGLRRMKEWVDSTQDWWRS